jgi:plasmid stabilization system protein ParE
MAFRVKQTAQAEYDLDHILEWLLAQGAGDAGHRRFSKLQEAINSLAEMPHRCMPAPEDSEFPYEVRQLLYGTNRIDIACCSRSNATPWWSFISGTVGADTSGSRTKLQSTGAGDCDRRR